MPISFEDGCETTSSQPVNVIPEVAAITDEIISNRRWFHAHPELSFKELITAKKIVEILRSYGITEIFEGIGKTGVVALIRGASPGPCIGLRADMDALPVQETATISYRSSNDSVMHACGHDGHMAALLGAARVLQQQAQSGSGLRCGVVKLIFQPAEEGYAGARAMMDDGVLEETAHCGPRVDFIYGIHLWSYLDLGCIGCRSGPVMAASDKFSIKVRGIGGHGAAPQGTVDAIVEAASLVTSLQTIIARNKDPLESGVITCGTIKGGYNFNVIADEVEITGTARSFTPEVQQLIKTRMNCVCCGVAQTFGGSIDLNYEHGYPPTVNSYPECNEVVINAANKIVGSSRAQCAQKTMGAEDFSYFLEQRPGCFFFVGAKLPGEVRGHHKSVFDFDERALLISASMFVQIVRDVIDA